MANTGTTSTVSGDVETPGVLSAVGGTVEFALNRWDVQTGQIIVPTVQIAVVAADGTISIDLWRSALGDRSSWYNVTWVSASQLKRVALGPIVVPDAPTADLNVLLATFAQNEDLDAALVAQAQAAADAAALSEANAAASEAAAAASEVAAASSETQATLAAKAAGAPIVTTLTSPVPANGSIEILITQAGSQVWEVVTGAWVLQGWLEGPAFDTVADVLADTTASYPTGTVITAREGGFAYRVAASGAVDHHVTTAGGVKLYVLPGADGWFSMRALGPYADGSSDDTAKILTGLSMGPIDGAGAQYAVTELNVTTGQKIRNFRLVGISSSSVPLKIGDVGAGALYNNQRISVRDITVSGVGSYAYVFSNMTDFDISGITASNFSAANDIFYLHRMYAGRIDKFVCFGGSTAGPSGAVIRFNFGVSGLTFNHIYTSAFIKYGVVIDGGCTSLTFNSPVLQGHGTAWNILDSYGVVINSPYTENSVNPFVIGAGTVSPRGIVVQGGGYLSNYQTSNPFAADDNGVQVLLNRGVAVSFINTIFTGVGASTPEKQIASVNNGAVLVLIDPLIAPIGPTVVITDFLRKEVGASPSSGYYIESTGGAGYNTERAVVERSNQSDNSHVIRHRTTGTSGISETLWTPLDNV